METKPEGEWMTRERMEAHARLAAADEDSEWLFRVLSRAELRELSDAQLENYVECAKALLACVTADVARTLKRLSVAELAAEAEVAERMQREKDWEEVRERARLEPKALSEADVEELRQGPGANCSSSRSQVNAVHVDRARWEAAEARKSVPVTPRLKPSYSLRGLGYQLLFQTGALLVGLGLGAWRVHTPLTTTVFLLVEGLVLALFVMSGLVLALARSPGKWEAFVEGFAQEQAKTHSANAARAAMEKGVYNCYACRRMLAATALPDECPTCLTILAADHPCRRRGSLELQIARHADGSIGMSTGGGAPPERDTDGVRER